MAAGDLWMRVSVFIGHDRPQTGKAKPKTTPQAAKRPTGKALPRS